MMKVYVSSDHGGFDLKNKVVEHLGGKYEVVDVGPKTLDPTDDYPVYTEPLAKKVSEEKDSMGILICRNGVGVSIAANKFDNVRCGLSFDPKHVKSARNDDNINVLALPSDFMDEETALKIVDTFLETPFGAEDIYIRRLAEITELEDKS